MLLDFVFDKSGRLCAEYISIVLVVSEAMVIGESYFPWKYLIPIISLSLCVNVEVVFHLVYTQKQVILCFYEPSS